MKLAMKKYWPVVASLTMIAWAGALQWHVATLRQTPEYKEKFKDVKPVSFSKLLFGRSKD